MPMPTPAAHLPAAALALLAAAALAACASEAAPTPTPTAMTPPALALLTGVGDGSSSTELEAGLYVLTMSVAGNIERDHPDCDVPTCVARFEVTAGNRGQQLPKRQASVLDAYWSGRSLLLIGYDPTPHDPPGYDPSDAAPGEVFFHVQSASAARWTIAIQPAEFAPITLDTPTLSGNGEDVRLFEIEAGPYVFDFEGNEDCKSAFCSPGGFSVYTTERGKTLGARVPFFTVYESNGSGRFFLEAGEGKPPSTPVEMAISVYAREAGTWTIDILPAASIAAKPVPARLTGKGRDVQFVDLAPGLYVVRSDGSGYVVPGDGNGSESFAAEIGAPVGEFDYRLGVSFNEFRPRRMVIPVGDGAGSIPPGRSPVAVNADSSTRWGVQISDASHEPHTPAPATTSGEGQNFSLVQLDPGTYDVEVAVEGIPDCFTRHCRWEFTVDVVGDGFNSRIITMQQPPWPDGDRSRASAAATIDVGDGPGQIPPGVIPFQMDGWWSDQWELSVTPR